MPALFHYEGLETTIAALGLGGVCGLGNNRKFAVVRKY
jgi:hypothetical protein